MKPIKYVLSGITLAMLLTGCGKKNPEPESQLPTSPDSSLTDEASITVSANDTQAIWQAAGQTLSRCTTAAKNLNDAIDSFIASPREDSLLNAREAWKNTLLEYRHFYVFHYIAQTRPEVFGRLVESDFRIAAWPVQPGSLDSWGSYLYSGLVHDIGNTLSKENLLNLHGQVDAENATLGLYAIEYMLFGENGTRSVDDYVAQSTVSAEQKERGFKAASELPHNRRRMLLQLQSDILVDEINHLLNNWSSPTSNSYSIIWNSLSTEEKSKIAKTAMESGLAQLIIDISTLNITSLEEEVSEVDTLQLPFSNLPVKQYIANALRSLQKITPLLNTNSQTVVSVELEAAISLLNEEDDKDTTSPNEMDWQLVYTHLKNASEAISVGAGEFAGS